ncbi:MAG: hypothetical protein MUO77_16420 [Anaerolineales bacterium]|nr:hypothetical protein [Anaerolineales bacterium]
MSKTISAGKTPVVEIEMIGGDLSVVGWEGDDILLKADEDELRVEEQGERVKISCEDDLSLRLPKAASIYVNSVEGDMSLRSVMGGVELKEIHGDLSIRDVNSVSIGNVHADLSLRGAKGNLSVKTIHGDASIREVEGHVLLESISDDLALRDVRGNVSANVGDDVVLYLDPQPGNAYTVTAGNDILLVMPPKANATLTLNGDEVDIAWKGIPNEEDVTSRVVILGDGSAVINLNAGGDIRVTNQSDAGDSAEDFGNFAGIGFDWSGFGERISKKVHDATKRVEEAARRVERQAERHTKHAKASVKVGRWNWDVSPGQFTPAPPNEAVSDQERMSILKMLAEKKITSEQADKLLSALEGSE